MCCHPAGNETVKAPGNLVVSAYVTCPDITQVKLSDGTGGWPDGRSAHCENSPMPLSSPASSCVLLAIWAVSNAPMPTQFSVAGSSN
jgi:hypothetical protein